MAPCCFLTALVHRRDLYTLSQTCLTFRGSFILTSALHLALHLPCEIMTILAADVCEPSANKTHKYCSPKFVKFNCNGEKKLQVKIEYNLSYQTNLHVRHEKRGKVIIITVINNKMWISSPPLPSGAPTREIPPNIPTSFVLLDCPLAG